MFYSAECRSNIQAGYCYAAIILYRISQLLSGSVVAKSLSIIGHQPIHPSTALMDPNDSEDDDFFGDDDDDEGDVLAEREIRAQEQQLENVGFLEAFEEAKEDKLQQGFEDGYTQNFDASVRIGELLGEAALEGDKEAVNRIRKFLNDMQKSQKKPSVTQNDLLQLETELLKMKTSR